jgi:hypothetical protein
MVNTSIQCDGCGKQISCIADVWLFCKYKFKRTIWDGLESTSTTSDEKDFCYECGDKIEKFVKGLNGNQTR